MPWVKLDDRFFTNPKVIGAGRDARDLYLAGLCYCAAELTDGFVPEGVLPLLVVMGGVTPLHDHNDLVTRLLQAALWETAEGGYRVHDYLDYNPSAAQVKRDRAANAKRVQEWRGRHPEAKAARRSRGNGITPPVRNGGVTPPPYPSPVDTSSPTEKRGHASGADAPAPLTPRGNPKVAAVIDALKAEGMRGTVTARDAKAIKDTEHDPGEVAALYAAIFRGEYGDDFMLKQLSVSLCLEKMPGWLSHRAGHAAPAKTNVEAVRRRLTGQDYLAWRREQVRAEQAREDAGGKEAGLRRLPDGATDADYHALPAERAR